MSSTRSLAERLDKESLGTNRVSVARAERREDLVSGSDHQVQSRPKDRKLDFCRQEGRWSRMRRMTRPSVMKETTRITPWQRTLSARSFGAGRQNFGVV
jgi:hypothetical protein